VLITAAFYLRLIVVNLQMIRPIFLAAAAVVLFGCGNKNQQEKPTVADSTQTAKDSSARAASPYFPVYAYLRSEIQYVDSLPVGIMKYTLSGGKVRDSSYIKLEEFHKLAEDFLTPELTEPAFATSYQESSFFDRGSNNATFLYKANNDSIPVKRIDVVTAKGEVYDDVKSIYIEKLADSNGLPVTKKLYWKPKRNFQIITVYPEAKGKQVNDVIKVVWDNRE
jgi:hypothetical protein